MADTPQAAGAQDDLLFQISRHARYRDRLVHQPLRIWVVSGNHQSQIC